ncbi:MULTISPECIES: acetyltransferase [Clostridium]|uniref:acetyltransferase n=1 Tax=Clostridium TaxID=1485 RepID=UPI0029008C28|nr:acetyltransferase [Clostridium sp.]MDU1968953.1 acetyltransferase [Clostridium perfringens]MDU1824565.1 acetyltransferase [Clostridium sp.]MDU1842082.1 acetyltransferase [Clostridium sp.]MDU2691648.1 acetyltransferase [Clostridium sp.]MDU2957498.1 acetyltransferase [Clostridium sp.]
MKDIVIIGAGGVGSETAWIIEQINLIKDEWNLLGFIDDNELMRGKDIIGYKVIGSIEKLINTYKNIKKEDRPYIVIAIANYNVKKDIVNKLKNMFNFATLIHPDVFIHTSNSIGEGCIIYPGVIMTVDIKIGDHVIVSPKCGIGHNSKVDDYVSLLWNVNVSGYDTIGEGSLIGSGVTIIQNKIIGKSSIVGAGSVVVKDIEANKTVVGVPAKIIK